MIRSDSSPRSSRTFLGVLLATLPALALGLGCGDGGKKGDSDRVPGQTSFTSEEIAPGAGPPFAGGSATGSGGSGVPTDSAAGRGNAPGGRTGPVEEADIYRIADNRLFYLNTYRGFLIYDVNDPKQPRLVSRLPVYGYPVEMFVSGNTVYALLRDALYLTQKNGALEFQRHNVSQLVAIDVSDISQPRLLQTVDIVGELREGVSRKIENTVYVVSYIPQTYYWGWGYELDSAMPRKEQAWVYSFNVADPRNLKLVQKLQIFEGGSVSEEDPVTGGYASRYFGGVAISATSNSLMVVENWHISAWTPGTGRANGDYSCGSYTGDQRAIVSIVDVSDPTGVIRLHSRFQTRGSLGDQFKQTYVYDEATGTGTYHGIFARQAWTSVDCSGTSFIQNTLESWDVTNGGAPVRLDSLDFGKPNETVRGSAFDPTRKVAYAITAQAIDPLYVLDYADRTNLVIRSEIDGLSGDMNLFRLVENNQYLIGIGRDSSETCSGFQGSEMRRGIGMAVSLIDVRNLDAIRLMQRQCVAVENAEWVSSEINWNLDQAHKMIGMHSDGTANVITVPVSYYKQTQDASSWWYRWETAVGIMSWDVAAYDPARPPAEQTVIRNYGTFLHPNGEVRRSIVFTHQGSAPQRMMINLSDTHVSIANLQNLAAPQRESEIEIAPYVSQLYAFGGHVVERVDDSPYGWYGSQQGRTEFRVKRAGTNLDDVAPVARFSVGQVTNVVQHGGKLVVFRNDKDPAAASGTTAMTEVRVYDLANPAAPTLAGSVKTSLALYPYYWFFCGVGLWDGFWWGQGDSRWTATADALVFLNAAWDSVEQRSVWYLVEVDLRAPSAPAVRQTEIAATGDRYLLGLLPDAADPGAFFLGSYEILGQRVAGTATLTQTRYYTQRYRRAGDGWAAESPINLPGRLIRSWSGPGGTRLYLSSDTIGYQTTDPQGSAIWRQDTRLHLLRAAGDAAELRSSHRFADQSVSDVVIDGARLFANAAPGYRYYYGIGGGPAIGGDGIARSALTADEASDRLIVFDLTNQSLERIYDRPIGTMNVQLMGTHRGMLFMNLRGDGLLAVDVADAANPIGRQFLRTLGWASHVVFAENDVYVGAGYFGVYRMSLGSPAVIPTTN